MSNPSIAFVGAGNMAASLIGGLRAQGVAASAIRASEPGDEQRARLQQEHGIATFADNAEAIKGADLIVLAVKPQIMKAVCLDLAPHLAPNQVIISIAAGISCASLESWLGDGSAIVRCMPNTPSLRRQGVSGLFANAEVSDTQKQQTEAILNAVGISLWLEREELIDAVTAVSGSGPAYFFYMMEAMTAAGEQLGLPRDTAERLTLFTALGAADMAVHSDVDAAELRRRVCSPGGTTERAINSFAEDDLPAIVARAMQAAAARAAEMTKELA